MKNCLPLKCIVLDRMIRSFAASSEVDGLEYMDGEGLSIFSQPSQNTGLSNIGQSMLGLLDNVQPSSIVTLTGENGTLMAVILATGNILSLSCTTSANLGLIRNELNAIIESAQAIASAF